MRGIAYDIVVVGAGPAGSVLAAQLAKQQLRVLLVESTEFLKPRVGEFLAPSIRAAISELGLLGKDWEAQHQKVPAFVSNWGGRFPVERDYVFDPNGYALALDRVCFDRDLAEAAVEQGATLLTRTYVRSAAKRPCGWEILVEKNGVPLCVKCEFLVLCSGRSGTPIEGVARVGRRISKLVCLGLRLTGYEGDVRPTTEAYSNGWAYSIGLASGELIVNLFTLPFTARDQPRFNSLDWLLRELSECPFATERVLDTKIKSVADVKFTSVDASSLCSRPVGGNGWCLAGDAAQSLDPLSSGGIMQALHHAKLVSHAFRRARSVHDVDLTGYAETLEANYAQYIRDRRRVYKLVQRWQTPFWQAQW